MSGDVGFHRLHPRLQQAIHADLGWRQLRAVQSATIDAVLDGQNVVVLAPTAGGKTEAAMFPALSRLLTEGLSPVAVLYICPTRALLNNQAPRLRHYASMVGLEAFKWHGDVACSARSRFKRSPSHVLMTTPESVEVLFMRHPRTACEFFRQLAMVIVDEVHAFAGDDRGGHLVALLERLSRLSRQDIQRIGLSATVGNPGHIGRWLQGSSRRPRTVVDPPGPANRRTFHIDVGDNALAQRAASGFFSGKKTLVFAEGRQRVEDAVSGLQCFGALQGAGVCGETFAHHSSVSRADRRLAETRFVQQSSATMVSTSTMELGIDVGDIDQVIQLTAPRTVASLLQRMGRTGRRAGASTNCTVLCDKPTELLQTVAIVRLAERGWVESVAPSRRAMHILAHQIIALSVERAGVARRDILPSVKEAFVFADVEDHDVERLVDTMVAEDILYDADGLLSLGREGERRYGARNGYLLYGVFETPAEVNVRFDGKAVGRLDRRFVWLHFKHDNAAHFVFRLAGRCWQGVEVDWKRGILDVEPSRLAGAAQWIGAPQLVSYEVCQAMAEVLRQPGREDRWMTEAARRTLQVLRERYRGLVPEGGAAVEEQSRGPVWHTFAGGAINALLVLGLETLTKQRWHSDNLSVSVSSLSTDEAERAIAALPCLDWERLASQRVQSSKLGRLSKFQPCLPEEDQTQLLVRRTLDVPGTRRFVGRFVTEAPAPACRSRPS